MLGTTRPTKSGVHVVYYVAYIEQFCIVIDSNTQAR